MTTLEEKRAANLLDEAAGHIAEFGWKPDGGANKSESTCVWGALTVVADTRYTEDFLLAERALIRAANTSSIGELFRKNDSMPEDEGQAWAFDTLLNARDSLDPSFDDSIAREQNWFTAWVSRTWQSFLNWRKSNQA